MALQLAYTVDATGAAYPTSYHRVDEVTVNLPERQVRILVSVFVSNAARAGGKRRVAELEIPSAPRMALNAEGVPVLTIEWPQPDFDAFAQEAKRTNIFAAAYVHLRTLPLYAGATDV